MATIRTLSTGEVMIYDDKNRELFIIEAAHAEGCAGKSLPDSITEAKNLVKSGKGQHFDRRAVDRLQQAFASVGVLG